MPLLFTLLLSCWCWPAPPALPLASGVRLAYVPGSTRKVEQLVGDTDRATGAPTRSLTHTRYGIVGTDLGYPVEHADRVCFLFGDTLGVRGGDPIGCTTATRGDAGVRLDFLTDTEGRHLRIEPPGIPMGGYEVPVAGIDLDGEVFVAVRSKQGGDEMASILTLFDGASRTFLPLRELSRLPDGHFLQGAMHREPEPIPGLPEGGPWVLFWGTGAYRASLPYLSIVPEATFATGDGTRYYAGMADGRPRWAEREADATPILDGPDIGDMSVTWIDALDLWLMVHDQGNPFGILVHYAEDPWGPWSPGQRIFELQDHFGKFIHMAKQDDDLAGPVVVPGALDPKEVGGAAYAPYVVERFTRVEGDRVDLYYLLSTWNPYVVVLVTSQLEITR